MTIKVKYLVVDTTVFLQNKQLQEIAENILTVKEVIGEIQNDRQLKRLTVLPYDLEVRDPFPENLKHVIEFSKKTGDYSSLSLTDLQLVALTYELEKEHVGTDHLRKEPITPTTVFSSTKPYEQQNHGNIAGFYVPKSDSKRTQDKSQEQQTGDESQQEETATELQDVNITVTDQELNEKFGKLDCQADEGEEEADIDVDALLVSIKPSLPIEDTVCEDDNGQAQDSGNEDDGDDDAEGWITPNNISKIKKDFGLNVLEDKAVTVACITSDFAIQNLLKQMGLNISSLDGRIIKHARTFLLRCYACFKVTPDVTKVFCPKCGNKTLKRVAVSLNEDGKQIIHINARKQITAKGKNKSIPLPKGGRHAVNPILFADQPIAQQRLTAKAKQKTAALDDDYIAGFSPFAVRDVDSRSAVLRKNINIKEWMQNYEFDNKRRGYNK